MGGLAFWSIRFISYGENEFVLIKNDSTNAHRKINNCEFAEETVIDRMITIPDNVDNVNDSIIMENCFTLKTIKSYFC